MHAVLAKFLGSDLSREIVTLRQEEYVRLMPAAPTDNEGTHNADRVEAKVLDIDPVEMAQVIVKCGGRQARSVVLLRRYVYDAIPPGERRWIRLRDTGSGSTLTIKEIRHDGIDGTDEVEIGVNEFETANDLLAKLGFTPRSYQENRRTSFLLEGARLEIDEWPLIPPYLEIEADSRTEVMRTAALLGYGEADLTGENTVSVYARYGIDLMTHARVSFESR